MVDKMIGLIVKKYFPGCGIQEIQDKGISVKRVFEILLDTGQAVILKVKVHPEYGDLQHEIAVEKLFRVNGLPAPHTLAVDLSGEIIPYPFILQEKMDGRKLSKLICRSSLKDQTAIYYTLGCLYRQMHGIKNEQSGLWSNNPKKILYSISPNEYMYQAEIINGSGKAALEQERITDNTYRQIVELWTKNMEYLKEHQAVLIHGSPFIWTIYLKQVEGNWQVTKLMSLGDVMWWDAAYDIAFLRYPPFGEVGAEQWNAFTRGYGQLPEDKRILLYALMQRLCAAMGVYIEPEMPRNEEWRKNCLNDLEHFLKVLEFS